MRSKAAAPSGQGRQAEQAAEEVEAGLPDSLPIG